MAEADSVEKRNTLSIQHGDMIGPPNKISNLRPIKYAVRENESELERILRQKREQLQSWNEEFWVNHNKSFVKEKEDFIKDVLRGKNDADRTLTADELSVFYKKFLDKNWKNHLNYNLNWHRQNFYVTYLGIRVFLRTLFRRIG